MKAKKQTKSNKLIFNKREKYKKYHTINGKYFLCLCLNFI